MEDQVCKNCGAKLLTKKTKQSAAQLKKPYYYSAYYFCPHCKKLYHDEKFKVTNGQLELGEQKLEEKKENSQFEIRNSKFDTEIWTDGACIHNGTPRARAAWGFVSGTTEKAGLVEGKQTNNVAEGLAIYHGLKWAAEKGYKKVKLHTDSQISLFNLAKPSYLVKANREIFEDIERVIAKNKLEVTYIKVLGHSGDINNERADRAANGMAVGK